MKNLLIEKKKANGEYFNCNKKGYLALDYDQPKKIVGINMTEGIIYIYIFLKNLESETEKLEKE